MDTEQANVARTEGAEDGEHVLRQAGNGSGPQQDGVSVPFRDVGQLWKAYRSLQAEFTRKCQRLSELERAGRETGTPRAEEPQGSASRSGSAGGAREGQPSAGDPVGVSPTGGAGSGREGDAARDHCADSLRERIIREYLDSVAARSVGEVSVRGGRVLSSPARRPTSFAEAGELFLKDMNKE